MTETTATDFEVLGLLGPAGSGKDLVADWLCQEKGFAKVSFADPIKRFASRTFGIDHDRLWGPSEKRNEMFTVDDSWWYEAIAKMAKSNLELINDVLEVGYRTTGYLKLLDWMTELRTANPTQISARIVLQTLGTEWGRSVDEVMWAKYAHKVAGIIRFEGAQYSQAYGLTPRDPEKPLVKGVVIPDHRFKNEVDMTHAKTGHVIRLRRLELEKKDETVGIAGHRSEAEQKTIPDDAFHLVIEFPEGIEKVYEILEQAYATKAWRLWPLQPTLRESQTHS